jgi:hypothetical protein
MTNSDTLSLTLPEELQWLFIAIFIGIAIVGIAISEIDRKDGDG